MSEQHPEDGEPQAGEPPVADGLTDVRLNEAVQRLGGLEGRPPEEHAEVYEDVHRTLQQALADAQADRPGA